MATRRLTVNLPEPLLDALCSEAARLMETPGQVAVRVLVDALPSHVEQALRRDLAPTHRARVIEVHPVQDAKRPPVPGGAPRPAIAKCQVTPSVPPGGPDRGSPGAAP